MIGVDVDGLKESKELQEFLNEKLETETKIEGNTITVGSAKEVLSRGDVKDCVDRFLFRRKLSDKYKTITDKDELKIIKKKEQ